MGSKEKLMDENKRIELMNGVRQATIAMDMFSPFLEKERRDILAKIKQQFRNNDHNLSVYIGLISTLVSLDDLELKMLKQIKAGKNIGMKE